MSASVQKFVAQAPFHRLNRSHYRFRRRWSQRFRLAYPTLMQIRVLYFGVLKDIFGCRGTVIELEDGASVAGLLESQRGSARAGVVPWDSIAVAVNQEYARVTDVLKDGDEVALLPPVSGGIECRAGSVGAEGLERYAG